MDLKSIDNGHAYIRKYTPNISRKSAHSSYRKLEKLLRKIRPQEANSQRSGDRR